MNIAILVNRIETETPRYTTTALARAARARGHEVFELGATDFMCGRSLEAWAHRAPEPCETGREFLAKLEDESSAARACLDDCSVLLLRNNPYDEMVERPWAAHVGLVFGEEAQRRGVVVLNDPIALTRAMTKLYLDRFPEEVRMPSIITRHAEDVRAFAKEHGTIVLKPLYGSGGRGVFIQRADEHDNANQIFEAVSAFGYVLAQAYLPEAREGDVRLLMLNGRVLEGGGKIAAFRRKASNGDLRNNVTAGGHTEAIEDEAPLRRIADIVGPQLAKDGIWLAGIDVVGDKVLEINVWSPGGVLGASKFAGVDFATMLVEDLERRV
jgi:glutathione synthase